MEDKNCEFLSEFYDDLSLGPLQEHLERDINSEDESYDLFLERSIVKKVVEKPLSKNIDLEVRNDEGETPLMLAVKLGNKSLVKKLIKNGAKVDSEDNYYNTPLLKAVMLNDEDILHLLLKSGASISVENDRFQTPLHAAVLYNYELIFDKLIEAGADVNIANCKYGTVIEAALTEVNLRIARKLLDKGASLSSSCVFSSLLNCYKKNFKRLCDFILENGFDVNDKGRENWSLLHLAVARDDVTVADNLLKRGANINAKDNSDETPLHFAVRSSTRSIVRLLLEHKPDVNAKNKSGRTPLHIATVSRSAEFVRLLLNAGANINVFKNSRIRTLGCLISSSKKVISYFLCARRLNFAKVRINLKQNDGIFPKNFTTLSAFDSKCLKELDRIKAKKFGGRSLYEIFSNCCDPVFVHCSAMEVYVMSDTCKFIFPFYVSILRKKFKEGKKRYILLNELILSVRTVKGSIVTFIVLPREMSRNVLVYLDDCDLFNVKKAFLYQ